MKKYLIAGLGNVGNEYAHTRHNIGFDVVMAFVRKHNGLFSTDRLVYKSEVKWKGCIFICICPTTYMNLSGKAVKYWIDKEKIELDHLLIVVDDLALPLDKLRLRPRGSDAGHNGLRDIQNTLGTTEYAKLRFGIGNQYPKGMQSDFVLSKWNQDETPLVELKIKKCIEVIEQFAKEGITAAMNNINNITFACE